MYKSRSIWYKSIKMIHNLEVHLEFGAGWLWRKSTPTVANSRGASWWEMKADPMPRESSWSTIDRQTQFDVDWIETLLSLADGVGLTFTYPEIATMIAANRIVIDSHREEFSLMPSRRFDRPVSAEIRKKTTNARMIFVPSNAAYRPSPLCCGIATTM